MFNRLSTARAALAALSLAAASLAFAQPEAPLQLALATQSEAAAHLDLQADAAQPLAVMLDQPTGGRFVYRAGEGWTYAGRQADAQPAAVAEAGQPVSLFIDEASGFVFNYVVDQGWVFAGRMDAARR